MDTQKRSQIVMAMARAAWAAADEPEPWDELPELMREEWVNYQDAALTQLEILVPEIRELLSP